jgi:hypothetical protein
MRVFTSRTRPGKTHTVVGYRAERGLLSHAAGDLCAAVARARASRASSPGEELVVTVTVVEVFNGKVFDLLNGRAEMSVREDGDGVVHVRGAATVADGDGRVDVGQVCAPAVALRCLVDPGLGLAGSGWVECGVRRHVDGITRSGVAPRATR